MRPTPATDILADAAGKRQDRAGGSRSLVAAPKPPAPSAGAAEARRAAGRGQGGDAGPHRAAARHARAEHPPDGATAGCTRSSSTATAPWRAFADGKVRLITRSGLDWTQALRRARPRRSAAAVPARRSSTARSWCSTTRASAASPRCRTRCRDGAGNKLVFYAFDLLHLDGWDLPRRRSSERKATARRSCSPVMRRALGDPVQRPCRTATAQALYEQASEMGLEGIVSKRANAPYQPAARRPGSRPRRCRPAISSSPATPLSDGGRRAWRRWRSANGSMASCDYRGKVGTGFDAATLTETAGAAASRCGPGAAPLDGRAEGRRSGCGRCCRPTSTMPTSPATMRCATRCFKGLREPELSPARPRPSASG